MTTMRRVWVKAVDGFQYAVVLNALVVAVLAPSSLLVAGTLVGLKWTLFLVGLLLFGVGTVQLRPGPPGRGSSRRSVANTAVEGGFGNRIARLPPVARYDPGPDEHLSAGNRFLLAGGLSLVVSAVLEIGLGVGVPTVG